MHVRMSMLLGCIMYEALTGLPPLIGENLLYTFQLHIEQIPASMREAWLTLETAWARGMRQHSAVEGSRRPISVGGAVQGGSGRNKQPSAATVIKDPAQNNEQEAVSQNARPRWLPVARRDGVAVLPGTWRSSVVPTIVATWCCRRQ